MYSAGVDLEVAFLRETTITAGKLAKEFPPLVQVVAVLNIDMCGELAPSLANLTTLGTSWRVERLDVVLHLSMCGEAYGTCNSTSDDHIIFDSWRPAEVAPIAVAAVLALCVADHLR